jgi:agmatinase
LAKENPVIIHFDAHRDMKSEYGGMTICHTTPFYHLIRERHIPGKNIIQIGIRQSDQSENQVAEENKVVTFDAWYVRKQINDVFEYLRTKTKNKKIYISFDIDVYDLPYVPCTGTPEPFGLNPFEIVQILKSISKSAKLIGLDLVEAGVKNNDYREGTLATQTLLRILCRDYVIQRAIQPKK